jgi:AcrR family transcriptional regulator
MMASTRAQKNTLTREDWVDAGLKLLSKQGVAAVGAEQLATLLGVTKGSFYWHFHSRDELLEALRTRWAQVCTDSFIASTEASGGTATERLRALLMLTAEVPKSLERAIRSWAVTDTATADYVAAIDNRRVAFVRGLLHGMGHSAADADALAQLTTSFVVGETMRGLPANIRNRKIYARLLTLPQK